MQSCPRDLPGRDGAHLRRSTTRGSATEGGCCQLQVGKASRSMKSERQGSGKGARTHSFGLTAGGGRMVVQEARVADGGERRAQGRTGERHERAKMAKAAEQRRGMAKAAEQRRRRGRGGQRQAETKGRRGPPSLEAGVFASRRKGQSRMGGSEEGRGWGKGRGRGSG